SPPAPSAGTARPPWRGPRDPGWGPPRLRARSSLPPGGQRRRSEPGSRAGVVFLGAPTYGGPPARPSPTPSPARRAAVTSDRPPASGAPSLPARRGGVLPAALERSDSVVRARTTDERPPRLRLRQRRLRRPRRPPPGRPRDGDLRRP